MSSLRRESRWQAFLVGLILVRLASAPSLEAAPAVQVEFDGNTDFSKLETYAWIEEKPRGPNDPFAEGAPMDRVIRAVVDEHLRKRGMRQAAEGEADVLVTYHGVVSDTVLAAGSGLPARGSLSSFEDTAPGPEQKEGTLLLAFLDPGSREYIWTGISSETGHGRGDAKQAAKKAEKLTRRVVKKYPPK